MKTPITLRTAAWAGLFALTAGLQTARAEPFVYVPMGSDNKIVVVDAATDRIVNSIGGVTSVHGLAGTPDGQFLVAGSFEERDSGSEAMAKPSGVSEDEHAAHHKAPVAKAGAPEPVVSTVSVVRVVDGSLVRSIDVPGAVHHVAVSPDGLFAAVTHPNEGGISVIDLTAYDVVATVSTGPLPNYAVFSPGGGRLYVSNAGNDTISEVETAGWTELRVFGAGTGPEHIVLSEDGQRLYVANADGGTVSEIVTKTAKTDRTFDIGGSLHGIDLSQNTHTLFVSARELDKLIAIDLLSGEKREAALAPEPYHLATIGDGGKLYVSSADEPKIWVVDQKTLAVTGEIPIGGKGHQIVEGPVS
jgi:DNA-binding beta-propeller fold protein YncE